MQFLESFQHEIILASYRISCWPANSPGCDSTAAATGQLRGRAEARDADATSQLHGRAEARDAVPWPR